MNYLDITRQGIEKEVLINGLSVKTQGNAEVVGLDRVLLATPEFLGLTRQHFDHLFLCTLSERFCHIIL